MRYPFALLLVCVGLWSQTRTQTIHVGEPVTNAPGGNPGRRTNNKTGKNIPNGLPGPPNGNSGGGVQPQPQQPSQAPVGKGCPGTISQVCDAQVLATVLFERYSSGYPIRVVRLSNSDMPQTWLVLLAGTEFNIFGQSAQSNTPLAWQEAFQMSSTFRQEVAQVITSWAPAGSNLILVGHSLGGMVSQNLAADSAFRSSYKSINVISYGSPKTADPVSGVDYVWFAAVNDIVPTINPLNLFSQPPYIWVTVTPSIPSTIGVHNAYPTSTDLANYDGLGHKLVGRVLAWVRTGTWPGKCLTLDQSMSWCATAPQ